MINFHSPPFKLKQAKIELTYECPLACIHCSSEAIPKHPDVMSYSLAVSIVNEMAILGVQELAFSGGEPLIWKRVEDIVHIAASKSMDVMMYTSGNNGTSSTSLSSLHQAGLNRVAFSLYSDSEERHESITRRKGSFQKTISVIEEAVTSGIITEIHFVPMLINYKDLPGIVSIALKHGVKKISVLRFVPQGRGRNCSKYVLTRNHDLELARMIRLERNNIDIRCGSPYNYLLINESPSCCAAIDRVIIDPLGNVYPCDAFKQIEPRELVGTDEFCTVGEKTLSECWKESQYLKAVRDYLTTDFVEPCKSCRLLDKCLSGCLAQKVILNRSLKKDRDPSCLIKHD